MSVSYERCVLSSRGLRDGPITRRKETTDCGVSECHREASIMRRPWPTTGFCAMGGGGMASYLVYMTHGTALVEGTFFVILELLLTSSCSQISLRH